MVDIENNDYYKRYQSILNTYKTIDNNSSRGADFLDNIDLNEIRKAANREQRAETLKSVITSLPSIFSSIGTALSSSRSTSPSLFSSTARTAQTTQTTQSSQAQSTDYTQKSDAELSSQLADNNAKITQLTTERDNAKSELDKATTAKKEADDKMKKAYTEENEHYKASKDAEAKITGYNTTLASLNDGSHALCKELQRLENELAQMQTPVDQNTLAQNKTATYSDVQIDAKEQEISRKKAQIEEEKNRLQQEIEKETKTKDEEMEKARKDYSDANTAYGEAMTKIQTESSNYNTKDGEIKRLQNENTSIQAEIDRRKTNPSSDNSSQS